MEVDELESSCGPFDRQLFPTFHWEGVEAVGADVDGVVGADVLDGDGSIGG